MKSNVTKILLAEDDPNLGSVFTEYLELKGFKVNLCLNGEIGFQEFKKSSYDLCILDVMMPFKDGFTMAKEIRAVDKNIPIIFLTAKSMKEDVIEGFKIGADDYITKPFNMEELLLRVHAVLKRTQPLTSSTGNGKFTIGKYKFESNLQTLSLGKNIKRLTTKESSLLKLLCLNINDVLKREAALKTLWGEDDYFNARSMDVFITKLRKYLSNDPAIEIMNVHGVGYKLMVK